MTVSSKVVRGWLDRCREDGEKLTPWEVSFLESVTDQFDCRGSLSERQLEVLERIYNEKVP